MPILSTGASGADAIEVRNLVKVYRGGTRAVDGISLTVRRGEIFGFLGPNGSGKTTVTKILVTLLKPTAGTARITGIDVTRSPREVRTVIGYAGQFTGIDDDLTAAENAAFHGILHGLSHAEAWQRAPELLAAFALGDVARQPAVRRHAPPARPGPRPRSQTQGDLPRRAHHRPGPAIPRRAVG